MLRLSQFGVWSLERRPLQWHEEVRWKGGGREVIRALAVLVVCGVFLRVSRDF